jgi:hypothetical protein
MILEFVAFSRAAPSEHEMADARSKQAVRHGK